MLGWLVAAVVALTLGAIAGPVTSVVVTAIGSAIAGNAASGPVPSAETARLLDEAVATGAPSLVVVRRLLVGEIGPAAADRELAGRILADAIRRHPGLLGRRDITDRLDPGPNPSGRLLLDVSGPLRLEHIATLADEPLPEGRDRFAEALAGIGPGITDTGGSAIERRWPTLRTAAELLRHGGLAFDLIGAAAQLGTIPDSIGPIPGERAGDVTLCVPAAAAWSIGGAPPHAPLATGVRLIVLRAGALAADAFVPDKRC